MPRNLQRFLKNCPVHSLPRGSSEKLSFRAMPDVHGGSIDKRSDGEENRDEDRRPDESRSKYGDPMT